MPLATEPPPDKTALWPLELHLSWSRAARAHLPDPKMAPRLKKQLQITLQITLQMAPPRFPSLKAQAASTQASNTQASDAGFALDFSMVDDAKIHELNRAYLGKDRPTDVLSFALWEEADGFPMPQSDEPLSLALSLGDIVLSTQTAARQALEQNHSFEREIAFLTIHGALHLLGYDHGTDSARRIMFARQNAIFEAVFAAVGA